MQKKKITISQKIKGTIIIGIGTISIIFSGCGKTDKAPEPQTISANTNFNFSDTRTTLQDSISCNKAQAESVTSRFDLAGIKGIQTVNNAEKQNNGTYQVQITDADNKKYTLYISTDYKLYAATDDKGNYILQTAETVSDNS